MNSVGHSSPAPGGWRGLVWRTWREWPGGRRRCRRAGLEWRGWGGKMAAVLAAGMTWAIGGGAGRRLPEHGRPVLTIARDRRGWLRSGRFRGCAGRLWRWVGGAGVARWGGAGEAAGGRGRGRRAWAGASRDGAANRAVDGRARDRGDRSDGRAAAVVPQAVRGEQVVAGPGRAGWHRRVRRLDPASGTGPSRCHRGFRHRRWPPVPRPAAPPPPTSNPLRPRTPLEACPTPRAGDEWPTEFIFLSLTWGYIVRIGHESGQ